jgi:hypothetical protein
MSNFKLVAASLAAFGILAGGAVLIAQQPIESGANRKAGGAGQRGLIPHTPINSAVKTMIESRLAAAREIFKGEMHRLEHKQDQDPPYDEIPIWSRRWMDEQLCLGVSPAEKLAAIHAHLERVKRAEGIVGRLTEAGQLSRSDLLRATYYRLEAEQLFAEARAAHPDIPLPKPDPAGQRSDLAPSPPSVPR